MVPPERARPCFLFAGFTVSPARRALLREGRELPLIPRYFDLLVLLLERRHEAVHRHEILDAVWSDVVVSDGALNQAVRTLRRTLGDVSRRSAFIRTVSRHGYRFVYSEVEEKADGVPASPVVPGDLQAGSHGAPRERAEAIDAAVERLLRPSVGEDEEDDLERLDVAERLHELGTAEALQRFDRRPGHETARAFLREARWDVPGAGPVPLLGQPGTARAAATLLRLRLRRLKRLAGARWGGAVLGGASAGVGAGFVGGLALYLGPGSQAGAGTPVLLALVGLAIGGLGAAGVGLGLALAESLARSLRGPALVALGAVGGACIGGVAHLLGWLALSGLFGRDLSPMAGGFEGLVLGGAVGLGYQLATRGVAEGMATPRGWRRLGAAALAGVCAAGAAVGLAFTGSYLGAMSLDLLARSFPGSQVGLGPLARLLGEPEPGSLTTTVICAWEGLLFGFGTVAGLTHRPRPRRAGTVRFKTLPSSLAGESERGRMPRGPFPRRRRTQTSTSQISAHPCVPKHA